MEWEDDRSRGGGWNGRMIEVEEDDGMGGDRSREG